MKTKIYLTLFMILLLFPIVLATEDCEKCHTEIKVKANMRELEVSHDFSRLIIFGKVENLGDYTAGNVWVKLHYTPNDYEMGPEINAFPYFMFPLGNIWAGSWRPFFFIVELEDFYPFGPFPADDLEDGINFYVSAMGDNFNQRKSKVMEFLPIEEVVDPFFIEEPEELPEEEPTEEVVEEEVVEQPKEEPIKRKEIPLNRIRTIRRLF